MVQSSLFIGMGAVTNGLADAPLLISGKRLAFLSGERNNYLVTYGPDWGADASGTRN